MKPSETAGSDKKLACIFLALFIPLLLNGFYNTAIAEYKWIYWLVEILTWVIIPAAGVVFFMTREERTASGLFIPKTSREQIHLIILCVPVSIACYYIYTYSSAWADGYFADTAEPDLIAYTDILPNDGWKKIIVNLYFAFSAGIVEEIYFRGLLRQLFRNFSGIIFVSASSLLFSVIHWEGGLQNLVPTFIFGVATALYALRFKNLIPLILSHAATNYIVFS